MEVIAVFAILVIFIAFMVFTLSLFTPPKRPVINGIPVCPGQRYKIAGVDGICTVAVIGSWDVWYYSTSDYIARSMSPNLFVDVATLISAT